MQELRIIPFSGQLETKNPLTNCETSNEVVHSELLPLRQNFSSVLPIILKLMDKKKPSATVGKFPKLESPWIGLVKMRVDRVIYADHLKPGYSDTASDIVLMVSLFLLLNLSLIP
jgi:hypothetical protein